MQAVAALSKPCAQRELAKADPAVVESVLNYLDVAHECTLAAKNESTEKEQMKKSEQCLKSVPAWPAANMEAVCFRSINNPGPVQSSFIIIDQSKILYI